jgi:hypothetical protein
VKRAHTEPSAPGHNRTHRGVLLASVVAALCLLPAPVIADDAEGTTTTIEPPSAPGAPSEPAPVLAEPDPATKPAEPGTSETPAPTGSNPSEEPLTQTLSPEETYGACADQGPVISGQLLGRLSIAVPIDGQVTELAVEAAGGRVKEIEIPYYDWTTRRDGERIVATGPAEPREGFWLWVALDGIVAGTEEIEVRIAATLADGTVIRHGGEGSELTSFRIPVTAEVLANTVTADPDGPQDQTAGETPLNGRTPCRLGEPAAEPGDRSPLPLIATGLAGVLLGAAGVLLGRRRKR